MLPLLLAALGSVGVVEHLGQKVPTEVSFTDATGARVEVASLLDGKTPVVIAPVYFGCPALCGLVLGGLGGALSKTGLKAGEDYRVLAFSIDPHETPEDAAHRAEPWTFLVGDDTAVHRLTDALGFSYRYNSETKQYEHPAAVMVLTPDGRIARYFYGVEYKPKDLRLALVEASGGRVGTTLDRLELTCRKFDPSTHRYVLSVQSAVRAGGLVVFGAVAGLLAMLWRAERRRRVV
ncbi:MAG: SCO family protein [Myxococcaceae bacterium]